MASRRRLGLLLPLLSLALLLLTVSASDPTAPAVAAAGISGQPSAYEMLEGFGFPRGILPEGVTGYTYRASDGAFEVFMGGDCEFDVDGGYRLTYRRRIYGNVEGGSIRNLGGVSVRMFLLNWGIDRVVMEDAGHLMFYVGPLSQAFPADNFEESPQCRGRRCGGVAAGDGGAAGGVAAM
ncbi:hypothetical protein SEVIR_3G242600v4 [Setaria viridis]|uniref:Uncharacterized protein n=1 Tax=Setaria viridis TaxID=4556 RepID=A0A4U6VD19_SETVI|nr:uncharacterized protein LOC117848445 [Setaria viridis]TKW27198.1 hypothetical protein SEVIR_3G242600v2 [Setaria viridis]